MLAPSPEHDRSFPLKVIRSAVRVARGWVKRGRPQTFSLELWPSQRSLLEKRSDSPTIAVRNANAWRHLPARCAPCASPCSRDPCLPQLPDRNEIPFENTATFGLVLVRVEVNGRPAVLLVDTGSNHTVISSELADTPPSVWNNPVFSKKGSGFTGSGVYARVTARIGVITWRDHRVVVMNLRDLSKSLGQKIDGILGMDFFNAFDVVVVDLKNHKLIVQP